MGSDFLLPNTGDIISAAVWIVIVIAIVLALVWLIKKVWKK